VSEAQVLQKLKQLGCNRPTYDNVVTVDSEVYVFLLHMRTCITGGGKYQRLQRETEAITHADELVVVIILSTVVVAMGPGVV